LQANFNLMENQPNEQLMSVFEQIKHTDNNGNEFWMARQLARVIEYADFRNLKTAIFKAKEFCKKNGHKVDKHLVEANEMVSIGSGVKRELSSYKLSRYACSLILQYADSKKEMVAQGLSYFNNPSNLQVSSNQGIKAVIYTIDGNQIILDRDIARLYQTNTRTLKQAVKRNQERFPADFMFELSEMQIRILVSQLVIPSKSHFGGAKPLAFTEQGIAMLSAVLRTPVAIETSLQIIRTFIELRRLLVNNSLILQRLNHIEIKQLETDHKFEKVFQALEKNSTKPERGIFYKDAVFDAYTFVCEIIREAQTSIIIIDNYLDEKVLTLLSKRQRNVEAVIFTSHINKQLELDLQKHNSQYPAIQVKTFIDAHDRFLIIDRKEMYHIGASLKDLGKKWFAFSRMDSFVNDVLTKLQNCDKHNHSDKK